MELYLDNHKSFIQREFYSQKLPQVVKWHKHSAFKGPRLPCIHVTASNACTLIAAILAQESKHMKYLVELVVCTGKIVQQSMIYMSVSPIDNMLYHSPSWSLIDMGLKPVSRIEIQGKCSFKRRVCKYYLWTRHYYSIMSGQYSFI